MAKITYSAKLSNGHVVTRKSERSYSHFWRVWGKAQSNGFSGGDGGFANSIELANSAISSAISRFRKSAGKDLQINSEIVEVQIEPEQSLAA